MDSWIPGRFCSDSRIKCTEYAMFKRTKSTVQSIACAFEHCVIPCGLCNVGYWCIFNHITRLYDVLKLPCEPGRKGACPKDSLANHTAFSLWWRKKGSGQMIRVVWCLACRDFLGVRTILIITFFELLRLMALQLCTSHNCNKLTYYHLKTRRFV